MDTSRKKKKKATQTLMLDALLSEAFTADFLLLPPLHVHRSGALEMSF